MKNYDAAAKLAKEMILLKISINVRQWEMKKFGPATLKRQRQASTLNDFGKELEEKFSGDLE